MIKVNKSLSLLVIVFLILSNLAFAQYNSDVSSYEGKPIEPSREGKDYYREGDVIVYPAKMDSEEERMTQRFMRGELSEEQMRKIAKSKLGENFDEMQFKRGMIESKERMERKETFSYENEGYGQRYDAGPSYEGYSKEHMIFGRVFELIGNEIDPREIKQNCNEPEKIADEVISKLKDKVGDVQKVCAQMEEQEAKCTENAKSMCSRIGTAMVIEGATELEKIQSVAYSCPVNSDAIKEACRKRSNLQMEQRMKNLDETCAERFNFEGDRLTKECERFRQHQVCDRDKYINQCLNNFGIKKEDFDDSGKRKPVCPKYPVHDCGANSKLETKTDANGCQYYYCVAMKDIVCAQDVKQCADGSFVSREPTNNCNFRACPTASPEQCPSIAMPACEQGMMAKKMVDDRGCIFYNCVAIPCPIVQKPACNSGETIQAYYDTAGCATSYQCIRQQPTCPEATKINCQKGQSLTTKYDDKGCIVGYGCISVATATTSTEKRTSTESSQSTAAITAQVVLNTYEDFVRNCENNWIEQQKICLNTPNVCDKTTFIEKCREQESKNSENFKSQIVQQCEKQTKSEIKYADERCSRTDEDRNHCINESAKRCGNMKGAAEKCREVLTEEKLRSFIVEEAKKRCRFSGIIEQEDEIRKSEKAEIVLAVLNTATTDDLNKLKLFVDNLKEDLKLQDTTVYKGTIEPNRFGDIKLLPFVVNAKLSAVESSEKAAKEAKEKIVSRQKAEEAASKLVSLRDSDVPKEYLYIIEDKASDVLNVSNNLKNIEKKEEQKGLGYKIKLFLGLAKQAEKEEINQLVESKEKLRKSIETLAKLVDEVPSDVAKSILKEQVENLKKQQEDIEVLIETKEKKAKGLLGLFG